MYVKMCGLHAVHEKNFRIRRPSGSGDYLFLHLKSPTRFFLENEKIYDYINSIGKYDSQTQINEANEFCETFRILKDYYQQYYTVHYKIIYALGVGIGCLIAILLI